MLDALFLLKILFSFFVGGLVVFLSGLIAERFNPKLGGMINASPHTIVISMFLFTGFLDCEKP